MNLKTRSNRSKKEQQTISGVGADRADGPFGWLREVSREQFRYIVCVSTTVECLMLLSDFMRLH